MSVIIFILYMLVASVCFFGFAYAYIKFRGNKSIDYFDLVFYGSLVCIFWIFTVWFMVPYYIVLWLHKSQKIH